MNEKNDNPSRSSRLRGSTSWGLTFSSLGLIASILALASLLLHRAQITSGATIGLPDPALDPRPNNLFAVNVALESATPAQTEWVLETIHDSGFGWIKQNFRWAEIERAKGDFDWGTSDRIVDGARGEGLGIIAVLITTPEWARPDHSIETAPPVDEADFADFARAFAERYGDEVDVYQIWDEPNLASAWGRPDSAADYLRILKPAYLAIHEVDPNATVLLAALAPTVETGPNNLSDLLYLRALYLAGAAPYFDAASAKPYGFDYSPGEREADPNVFNFSRFILFRDEMVKHGDGHKLLWAGNFGWNSLPAGWPGDASIWGQVTEAQQAGYTAQAYARAIAEWPWAGPLALENFQPDPDPPGLNPFGESPANDPRWGFALVDQSGASRPVLGAVVAVVETRYSASLPSPGASRPPDAASLRQSGASEPMPPGNHPADDPAARYEGDWEFSDLGADIPQYGPAKITLEFVGTDLALRVRRADYRAYLYVTIDGQPTRALPRDSRGAYLVLTSPDLFPRIETVTVASGLPYGKHTAVVEADRGWDQWAIAGFSVGRSLDDRLYYLGLAAFGILAAMFAVSTFRNLRALGPISLGLTARFRRLTSTAQTALASLVAGLLWLSAWLTWGGELPQVVRRLGDTPPLVAMLLSAGVFYVSPWLSLSIASLAALFILFILRLDIALALVALLTPFYLQPRPMFDKAFSMVEITTLLAVAAWGLQKGTKGIRELKELKSRRTISFSSVVSLSSLDFSVVFFVAISVLSTLSAEVRGVAMRELRVIILEPALLYFLLRVTPLDRRGFWRIVDFWMIGAAAVAAIGLYQYATGTNLIAAEGGVMRLRSVFGSPNNVGLFLGRALPALAAIVLLGENRWRRILYALAALVVLAASVLSFSKGALILGVPISLGVVFLTWGWSWIRRRSRPEGSRLAGAATAGRRRVSFIARRPLLPALVLVVVAVLLAAGTFVALSRAPRFANLFDVRSGTSFFRLRLWQSSLYMIRDHPWLGVGPDNFLYAYRGQYINPEAWQDPNLSHPHNVVLDFASRLGLSGLASFVWMQVAFFKALTRTTRLAAGEGVRVALAASMINFLAHGLVDASYFYVDLAFVYFLTLGLAAIIACPSPASEISLHEGVRG